MFSDNVTIYEYEIEITSFKIPEKAQQIKEYLLLVVNLPANTGTRKQSHLTKDKR